uniref:HTH_48 domain-containing protein n=1 Tax=Rhabditophanes sp. KR3021 TaxID=114890 RepID=A0AC35TVX2_9BILA
MEGSMVEGQISEKHITQDNLPPPLPPSRKVPARVPVLRPIAVANKNLDKVFALPPSRQPPTRTPSHLDEKAKLSPVKIVQLLNRSYASPKKHGSKLVISSHKSPTQKEQSLSQLHPPKRVGTEVGAVTPKAEKSTASTSAERARIEIELNAKVEKQTEPPNSHSTPKPSTTIPFKPKEGEEQGKFTPILPPSRTATRETAPRPLPPGRHKSYIRPTFVAIVPRKRTAPDSNQVPTAGETLIKKAKPESNKVDCDVLSIEASPKQLEPEAKIELIVPIPAPTFKLPKLRVIQPHKLVPKKDDPTPSTASHHTNPMEMNNLIRYTKYLPSIPFQRKAPEPKPTPPPTLPIYKHNLNIRPYYAIDPTTCRPFAPYKTDQEHIRHMILHYFLTGQNSNNTTKMINQTYGEYTLSDSMCRGWFKKFSNGNFSVRDKDRCGRPVKMDYEQLRELALEKEHYSAREMGAKLKISHKSVVNGLKKIGFYYSKDGKWVQRKAVK